VRHHTGVIAKLCWVSGRVQGVYYRGTAVSRAREMGITGYARNLADGRVEVLAQGPEAAVAAFIEWLWIGSGAAKVTGVEVRDAPDIQPREGFTSG
jgi:acylphosphatase